MRLAVARFSTAVAAELHQSGRVGAVHSVFHAACNFATPEGLLSIVARSVGGVPNGLVVADEVDFLAIGLAPGQSVWSDSTGLQVPAASVTLDLAPARAWSPAIAVQTWRPTPRQAALRQVLSGTLEQSGCLPLLRRWVGEPVPQLPFPAAQAAEPVALLAAALATGDADAALRAARGLVGLGHGLTPSGDDLLVGCSAALRSQGSALGARLATGCAELARGRTTLIAETFHMYAARNAYAERVHRLLAALATAVAVAELARELETALDWGGTSGADLLFGVLLACDATRVG